MANYQRKHLIDALHELQVKICALTRVPFAGLGKVGLRFGRDANNHVGLARIHELRFDFVPGAATAGIFSGRFQAWIQFEILGIRQFKCFILFGDSVPDFFHQTDSLRDAGCLALGHTRPMNSATTSATGRATRDGRRGRPSQRGWRRLWCL